MDKKEKKEVFHYEMIYYYHFDAERARTLNYTALVLDLKHHLSYRYEILKIKKLPSDANRKQVLVCMDHKLKQLVEIYQVTDASDKTRLNFYEKNPSKKLQVIIDRQTRLIKYKSYLDTL